MSFLDSPLDGVSLPLFDFGQQQRFQITDVTLFSRIACSAMLPNCVATVGMRSDLQCDLMVASCNCAIWLLIAHLVR
jgi:hypothetical protein